MNRIASVAALFLAASSAAAQEFPRFDIETVCRAAPRLAGSDSDPYQSCVRDETEARGQLERQWTSFDAGQRSRCVQETTIEGSPSFVDVLTCIQMAAGMPPSMPARRRN
jgi:hypothetical protein